MRNLQLSMLHQCPRIRIFLEHLLIFSLDSGKIGLTGYAISQIIEQLHTHIIDSKITQKKHFLISQKRCYDRLSNFNLKT